MPTKNILVDWLGIQDISGRLKIKVGASTCPSMAVTSIVPAATNAVLTIPGVRPTRGLSAVPRPPSAVRRPISPSDHPYTR